MSDLELPYETALAPIDELAGVTELAELDTYVLKCPEGYVAKEPGQSLSR